MTDDATALALEDIVKRFGAVTALAGASLLVRRGTVHALLGENGAGKSTLARIAFGLVRPDAGSVAIGGVPVRLTRPADAIARGVGMVHQHFTNVPAMTVAENVALGRHGRFDRRGAAARVRGVSERAGLPLDPDAIVGELPVGAQQRLEIVKALAREATLLLLDEPTAVLAPSESSVLLRWARDFADGGGTIVLITHKLQEALAVADEVTVLRRGRTVLAAPTASVDGNALAAALLGEDPGTTEAAPAAAMLAEGPRAASAPVVVAEGIAARDAGGVERLRDATFTIAAGDVVGVAAVEGAGQHELLRALAGLATPTRGHLSIPGDVAFIPEDRHRDALLLDFPLTENVALRGAGARRGVIRWTEWQQRTNALLGRYDVRAPDAATVAGALSGGNQQKLVLARELSGAPPLVVAENPTRGLDIRATRFVHDELRRAAANGAAVVVYSTDLDEVLALSTRLLAVHAGVVREVALEREAAGRAMLGLR